MLQYDNYQIMIYIILGLFKFGVLKVTMTWRILYLSASARDVI